MAALDTQIEIAGRQVWIRRSFDLIRRIEERFGALGVLVDKCRALGVTHADLRDVFVEIIRDQRGADGIERDEIEAWIFDVGVIDAAPQALLVLASLFAGNKRAQEVVDEDDENPPKRMTGARRGESSSPQPTGSDGRRRSSGGRHTMN